MRVQHLSDEAVAACADGVLTGHPRQRAERHIAECAECRAAVRGQREAAYALRAAPAPALPSSLADRLRSVPMTTPITTLPTVLGPDGSTMLATFSAAAAPFVPTGAVPAPRAGDPNETSLSAAPTTAPASRSRHGVKPVVATVAVVALAGALTAGSLAREATSPAQSGGATVAHDPGGTGPGRARDVIPAHVLRVAGH